MTHTEREPQTVTGWATVSLALLLAVVGLAELAGPLRAADAAAPWGGADIARAAVGLLELAGAVLLLIPFTFAHALGVLGVALAGAGLLELRSGPGWAAVVPALLLGLTLALGAARGRRSRTLARLHAALDAFADRELARQRPPRAGAPAARPVRARTGGTGKGAGFGRTVLARAPSPTRGEE